MEQGLKDQFKKKANPEMIITAAENVNSAEIKLVRDE